MWLRLAAGRGHAGGLVGGALASWLLGPDVKEGPDGRLADRPPLPILAGLPGGSSHRSHK